LTQGEVGSCFGVESQWDSGGRLCWVSKSFFAQQSGFLGLFLKGSRIDIGGLCFLIS
jgi:hypothetical protein